MNAGLEQKHLLLPRENPLTDPTPPITDLLTYSGRSERIKGFVRIKTAIEGVPAIKAIDPLVLMPQVYDYFKSGDDQKLSSAVDYIFTTLDTSTHPVIVRRLFPDLQGNAQNGPRSGNISTPEDLHSSLIDFYKYFDDHYDRNEVSPELMVHRVVDVSNPLRNEEAGLPFPGGDVIQIGNEEYQIRATFGADESVQGYPADAWKVVFRGEKEATVIQIEANAKTSSLVPGVDSYKEIILPEDFAETPALSLTQVLSLAEACRRISATHGSHRLEFDGTRINGEESLFIIEAAPFTLEPPPPITPTRGKIQVFETESRFRELAPDTTAIVHLSSDYFRGNDRRDALTLLSSIAAEKRTKLLVLASGNIATQHAARVLTDAGHTIVFVGNEKFDDGEDIKVDSKDGKIRWGRKNPVTHKDRLTGKKEDKIGGKALGLRRLTENGFTTPEFAVVETSFFRDILDELDIAQQIPDLDTLPIDDAELLARSITDRIIGYTGPLLSEVEESLKGVFDGKGIDNFSVRSSATCEDGQYSFAGVFNTELDIEPDKVTSAVLSVLASGLSPIAVRTARSLNLKPSAIEMCVIVQEMVKAKKAGTVFTKDIASPGSNFLRIDAAVGGGHQIVDGEAERHHSVVFDKVTGRIVESTVFDRLGEVLSERERMELIELGLAIEGAFKEGPQDIEWLIDDQGKLHVLQARRI